MSQFRESKELKLIDLYMDFTVAAAGVPTLKAANSLGVKSIARNSAGNYTIVLISPYMRAVNIQETLISTAPASPIMSVVSIANVNGSVTPLSPSFQVQFQNSAGVATDPANLEEILLAMTFSKSTGA